MTRVAKSMRGKGLRRSKRRLLSVGEDHQIVK